MSPYEYQEQVPSAPPINDPSYPPPSYPQDKFNPNPNPNSLTIDSNKLKELVGKSFAQTLLYLNLTKQIIGQQLANNPSDDEITKLTALQAKIDTAIETLKLTEEETVNLKINPTSEETSVSIAELLLEIASLGVAVSAGGKKRKEKNARRKSRRNSKRNSKRNSRRKSRH